MLFCCNEFFFSSSKLVKSNGIHTHIPWQQSLAQAEQPVNQIDQETRGNRKSFPSNLIDVNIDASYFVCAFFFRFGENFTVKCFSSIAIPISLLFHLCIPFSVDFFYLLILSFLPILLEPVCFLCFPHFCSLCFNRFNKTKFQQFHWRASWFFNLIKISWVFQKQNYNTA